ncbi:MAG: cysteine desulfurase [Firmicutes bacterium HGW-Firmicutes-7]|nr:MAG: cysteine desulfurase [Firmicutes bacterium HGW-Firmicutes-7]
MIMNSLTPIELYGSDYYFLQNFKNDQRSIAIDSIRKDFPLINKNINGHPLIWLDNGATTQKPRCVIDALTTYYKEYNSNIHRGSHTLADIATKRYEEARRKVQQFLGASLPEEIIFVRGATEAINLVAETYGMKNVSYGDEILLTTMEHHSNIVPWQKLSEDTGAVIKVIPINEQGEILLEEYDKMLTTRTRIVAITHVSNILGTVNPIDQMIHMAHSKGAIVLIDGAQAACHLSVDVQKINADFYVFSGHKAFGPTGIGVLYGKKPILEKMPPWQRGGGMIKNVNFNKTEFNKLPEKFEAGTPNIADAIALGEAIDYMNKIGLDKIESYERALTQYAMESLSLVPRLRLIGTASNKTSILSFIIEPYPPDKVANHLNKYGIATRAGHHCAQPTLERYGLKSSNRASLAIYNTKKEIDLLVKTLCSIK